jgi:hypothetical protein
MSSRSVWDEKLSSEAAIKVLAVCFAVNRG